MPRNPACTRFYVMLALFLAVLSTLGTGGPAAQANWLFSYAPNQVTLDSGKRNNVFTVGDPVKFSLVISNYGTYTLQGTIRYEVRDYWGSLVDQGTVAAPTPTRGSVLSIPAVTLPGWYKLYLHQPASVAPWGDSVGGAAFVIFRPNANFPVEPSEYLPNNSGGSDGGDEVARGVTGMGPQRHPVNDVSQPDAAIAQIDPAVAQDKVYYTPFDSQRGRPLLIAFPNGIYSSDPTQQSKNIAGLQALVTHYHNDIKYWEPRNEPNYVSSGADYVNKELKPFYQTIKSIDPSCKVLGPAVVTIGPYGLSWIEDFLKAGGGSYIDAFSFHAYNNVNGDLTLTRQSLNALNALLTKYGIGNIEKWQTEQGYFAATYGAYQPRLQGRWTMLQMMVYEQYGIPKEHNHLWYDRSHGFWDFPAFWENEDGLYSVGSFDPAAPLMRVWSEELYGANFASAYDLGALGNKLYIGSLFRGPGKSVAAFQSAGRTDGSVMLSVSNGSSIHVVSAFGVASDLPVTAGQAVLPVPELPVYVELAPGQTVQPVPIDYGTDLALTPGTVATSSGNGLSPLNPSYPNDIGKVINGTLENWYWNQGPGDHPWMGNDTSFPAWVQVTLPQPTTISHAVVYAGVPWQNDGSLLDYELQYDRNGQWVTLSHPQEPTNVVDFFTPAVFCTADSYYSDRDVFVHDFAPVTTQKVRLLVHDVTWGGGATPDIVTAGGQTGPHQITLREIELYGPSGPATPPASTGTGLTGQYFNSVDLTTPVQTRVDPTVNFNWTAPPAPGLTTNLFSARWTGQVQPQYTQAYTFSTVSDDGVRLWVNGVEIINDWTDHPPTTDSGTITLTAGQKYDIKMEYYQRYGGAVAELFWSSPSQAQQVIPQSQLYPAAVPPPAAPGTGTVRFYPRTGSPDRLTGGRFQGSADGISYVDLGAIAVQPADRQWTTMSLSADPKSYRYLRYLSPNGSYGNIAEVEFYSGASMSKLTGTPFGSPGSYNSSGATFDKVFDGDTTTCFDAPTPNGNFTGIDQGTSSAATGTGLTGQYFNSVDLTTPVQTRVDPTVNFNWTAPPAPGLTTNLFSARWTGQVQPQYTQTYTFSTVSDDGVRLWVNGVEIINDWTDHPPTTDSGTITLTAGQKYDIKMEYYQRYGGAVAELFWSSPSQAQQVIPQSQLYPAAVPPPVAPGTGTVRFYPRTGSPDRLTGGRFQGSADGISYVDLGAIAVQPADRQWTTMSLSADPKSYRYLRYLSPNGSYGNIAEVEFYSGASMSKLTGTPFGSPGSYNSSGATFDKVFDGDTTTCFDAPAPNGNFAGIDQGH